jgi:hypothetical protein
MELLLYILFTFSCSFLAHDLLPVYYNGDNVRRLARSPLVWLLKIRCVWMVSREWDPWVCLHRHICQGFCCIDTGTNNTLKDTP